MGQITNYDYNLWHHRKMVIFGVDGIWITEALRSVIPESSPSHPMVNSIGWECWKCTESRLRFVLQLSQESFLSLFSKNHILILTCIV